MTCDAQRFAVVGEMQQSRAISLIAQPSRASFWIRARRAGEIRLYAF